MTRNYLRLLVFFLTLALSGCPGDFRREKQTGSSSLSGGSGTPHAQLLPNYESLNQLVFAPKCIRCHNENGEAKSIVFTSYDDIVNSVRELVVTGDPESSAIYLSITGQTKLMPPSQRLSDQEIDIIREWIFRKAPRQ